LSKDAEALHQAEEVLLEEHKELIRLFMHEDGLAWNMTYFFIVLNVGLLSVMGALLSRSSSSQVNLVCIILSFSAGGIGVAWRLALQRSELHRQSRMFRAMIIEDELTRRGFPLDTLRSCESRLYHQKVLADPEGNIRDLRWFEKIHALRIVHAGMIVIGLAWLGVGIIWLADLAWRTLP